MPKIVPFPKSKLPPTHRIYLTIETEWQGESPERAALSFARTIEMQVGHFLDPETSHFDWGEVKPE